MELFSEENAEEVMVYRSYQQKLGAQELGDYIRGIQRAFGELKEHRYKLSIVTSRLGNTTMQYLARWASRISLMLLSP